MTYRRSPPVPTAGHLEAMASSTVLPSVTAEDRSGQARPGRPCSGSSCAVELRKDSVATPVTGGPPLPPTVQGEPSSARFDQIFLSVSSVHEMFDQVTFRFLCDSPL